MEKIIDKNLEIIRVSRGDITEFFVHGQADTHVSEIETIAAAFDFLAKNSVQAVAFRVFADNEVRARIAADFQANLDGLNCPVTWICQPEDVFAVQVQAISVEVTPIKQADAVVGCTFEDDNMVCRQLSFVPDNLDAERFEQAGSAFEKIETILQGVGLDFSYTVRTWLFVWDILDWYDKLNLARDNFFEKYNIFNKLVPASTGVGVPNPASAALTTEAFAVKAKNDTVNIQPVISPLQCPALDYKSSFARATLVEAPDHRRMLVSGTASIEPGGETIHVDDVEKQVDLTMQVMTALIKNGGMDWSDVCRGIAYFKDKKDFGVFDAWCEANDINIPHIKVEAYICRDDLLFELEVDGMTT